MIAIHRTVTMLFFAAGIAGCTAEKADDGFLRGSGLRVATLPVAARVAIYDAAVREAFDVGPELSLLLHPLFLPREHGLEGGNAVPKDLADALRSRAVVKGVCRALPGAARGAPVCDAAAPGYIVRFSEIYRMTGDSVQVHLAAERYNTPTSAALELMRFEKAYQVVGKGTTWRVARVGRVTVRSGAAHARVLSLR